MKKVVTVFAVALMTLGFFSCTNDTAAEDEVYVQSVDGDEHDKTRD